MRCIISRSRSRSASPSRTRTSTSSPDASLRPTGLAREFRALASLALPIIVGQLAAFGMPLIDNILAGHLGPRVLGAVAIGTSIYILPLMIVIGTMMSLQPTVATLDGAGRRGEVGRLFHQGILLGVAAGLFAAVVLALGAPLVLRLFDVAPSLRPGATRFTHALAFALPSIGLFMAARGVSEGLSRTVPTMAVQACGLVVLAPLGWTLMYGKFGLPPLGALGSGIATAIAALLQSLAYVLYVRFSGRYPGVDWRSGGFRPDRAALSGLVRLGLPIAASLLMEAGMFSVAGLVMGSLGATIAAGNQIALTLVTLTFMVPLGIALAVTVRVGNGSGANDPDAIRRSVLAGYVLVAAAEACSITLLLTVPRHLVAVYTDDAKVAATAVGLLVWGAMFQLSDGMQVLANGVLRGLKDTRVPMLCVAISYWVVGLPLGAFLALHAGLGAPGLWMGLLAGLTLAAFLLGFRVVRLVGLTAVGRPGRERAAQQRDGRHPDLRHRRAT